MVFQMQKEAFSTAISSLSHALLSASSTRIAPMYVPSVVVWETALSGDWLW